MDHKLRLDFDTLSVESFPTESQAMQQQRGTVDGHALTLTTCDPYGACNTRNTCTTKYC